MKNHNKINFPSEKQLQMNELSSCFRDLSEGEMQYIQGGGIFSYSAEDDDDEGGGSSDIYEGNPFEDYVFFEGGTGYREDGSVFYMTPVGTDSGEPLRREPADSDVYSGG